MADNSVNSLHSNTSDNNSEKSKSVKSAPLLSSPKKVAENDNARPESVCVPVSTKKEPPRIPARNSVASIVHSEKKNNRMSLKNAFVNFRNSFSSSKFDT